jgi:hypothetical protein
MSCRWEVFDSFGNLLPMLSQKSDFGFPAALAERPTFGYRYILVAITAVRSFSHG